MLSGKSTNLGLKRNLLQRIFTEIHITILHDLITNSKWSRNFFLVKIYCFMCFRCMGSSFFVCRKLVKDLSNTQKSKKHPDFLIMRLGPFSIVFPKWWSEINARFKSDPMCKDTDLCNDLLQESLEALQMLEPASLFDQANISEVNIRIPNCTSRSPEGLS